MNKIEMLEKTINDQSTEIKALQKILKGVVLFDECFFVYNDKNNDVYIRPEKALADVKHWVINTLDLSFNWNIKYFTKGVL